MGRNMHLGVNMEGHKELLGMWLSENEGAKFWLNVLTELQNRGVKDILIADIYKARWQVELFFKWIKQNLKIKSFVGTSRNAVMTQIWIALCRYLLLAFLKLQSKLTKSMQQILRLLQINLFEKRDMMALLRGGSTSR